MRERRSLSGAVALASCLIACGGEGAAPADAAPPDAGPAMLVAHDAWSRVSAADDPFPDRPAEVTCEAAAAAMEDFGGEPAFVVETGPCSYITVSQPSAGAIEAGDELHVRVWHFDLTAPDPGEAHVAIMIGGEIAWEDRVSIPAESGLLNPTWTAETAAPEGTPIHYHLHNHGSNSWAFIELSRAP